MDYFSIRLISAAFVFLSAAVYYVINIDPQAVGFIGVAVLLILVFLFVTFLSGFVFYALRRKKFFNQAKAVSIREGAILGLVLTAMIFLTSQGLFGVWDAGFLVVAAVCLEIFLLSKKRRVS